MKKVIIAVAVLLAIGIALMALPLVERYSYIQYDKSLEMATLKAGEEGGSLTAVDGDVTTSVVGSNLSRVYNMLTLGETKSAMFEPRREISVSLTYSTGETVSLAADPDKDDRMVIYFKDGGGEKIYSIEGYKALDAIRLAVSPEGFANANTVIEDGAASDETGASR